MGHGKHDATLECDFYTAECSSSALPPGDTASMLLIDEEVTATCNLSCSGVISIGKGALGCATERCRNEDRRCNASPVPPIAVTKQDQAALKNELNLQIHDTLRLHHLHASSHKRDALFESLVNRTPWSRTSVRKGMAPKYSAFTPVKAFQASFVVKDYMPPFSMDFSALVCESSCTDPLPNHVKLELYLPSHRRDFFSRKLSEMTRCCTVALQVRCPAPVVETSTSSTTAGRLLKDSTSAPAAPEAPFRMVDNLSGIMMMAWCGFLQLASGAWTLIICCAVFYICAASDYSSKQIHRRICPRGRLVLAVLMVAVLRHPLSSVGAVKLRPFRVATSNLWREGIANTAAEMIAGPDGSLYAYGGLYTVGTNQGNLWKLDVDTKE